MSDNKTAYTGKDYPVHTDGPWGYEDFALSSDIVAIGQKLVATVQSRCCNSPEEMRANAKLIAAAPEMLEALRRVDNYFTQPGEDDWVRFCKEALEPVRRAIKLAMEG
jgi:hypothetical protein